MTFAPAVLASDASSPSGSRGSAVEPGRITPTSTARSWRTDNSVRFSSAKSVPQEKGNHESNHSRHFPRNIKFPATGFSRGYKPLQSDRGKEHGRFPAGQVYG